MRAIEDTARSLKKLALREANIVKSKDRLPWQERVHIGSETSALWHPAVWAFAQRSRMGLSLRFRG